MVLLQFPALYLGAISSCDEMAADYCEGAAVLGALLDEVDGAPGAVGALLAAEDFEELLAGAVLADAAPEAELALGRPAVLVALLPDADGVLDADAEAAFFFGACSEPDSSFHESG